MIISEEFSKFCSEHYDVAMHYADMTIGAVVNKNGPLNSKYDIESVKALGVISSLEKAFLTYNSADKRNAKLSTYLSNLVHNDVLTELGKEKTRLDRFRGRKSRKPVSDGEPRYSHIMTGVGTSRNKVKVFEPHEYMDIFSASQGKEKQIREMMKKFRQLPPMDQLVLTFWMNEEKTNREYYFRGEQPHRTYVERILDELGWDNSMANAVTIRCFKAKKKLKTMMTEVPVDYENICGPGYSNRKFYSRNYSCSMKIYTDSQYSDIEKFFLALE